ncbi:N-6 DNA methylase [Oculatella sp. FACHB-28]|uniref:type ISP restriction/modification enzyme n=1 Tax=Oculatella sp. FACHB-28 TaxID=2692845 RepID=UPI001682A691|nr:type ISP restriction/modification enzyme [Oculatella sp. FACHB-28]MBD2054810.1 N-6 DNA methylase [Oculatella sp. FACHB-28]
MSRLLVTQYQAEVEEIVRYGGSKKETSIRSPFERLLNGYCKPRNYLLIPELDFKTRFNTTVFPDGTVKDAIRLEHGWWESKDQYDKLDEEIEKKLAKGYPDENILFEDSQTAVLIQRSREHLRVSMRDAAALDELINAFVDYERPEVRDFRAAIVKFKEDVPHILEALRSIIAQQEESNTQFKERRNTFLQVCRQSINPEIEIFDIHEMLIQHILTEDIFTNIFHESQFHRENNIARELSEMINTFFTGATRKNTLKSIEHYYAVIRRHSGNIANHHEKQKFLKAVYENFYKAYNPKAADRLGIVYTPNEIVRFMIESAEYLTHKHFGKLLSDPGVEILDPCTGTGTYVTELIEYLPADKLEHKYKNEIHCNEVAILPYYIANLNIEFTYQQKMGKYEEFKNICLVDTLEHCGFEGKQFDLFAMSVQNTERIQEQNKGIISVIIGNPPYNANQENENDNNKDRSYDEVDRRIKETYIKESQAQKMKLSDPYSRFFRWASDRLDENGILAFISNSSFVDRRGFDGFRKSLSKEFETIYVIDLGGDSRSNPKLSGTTHNVFGIRAGVAISFLIKKASIRNSEFCRIFYSRRDELEKAEDKLSFLRNSKFDQISFSHIQPDKDGYWINLVDNNFDDLIQLASKSTKISGNDEGAVFKLYSLGSVTNRDEWVYDFNCKSLESKSAFFFEVYEKERKRWNSSDKKAKVNDFVDRSIKWTSELENYLKRNTELRFDRQYLRRAIYRPYVKKYFYYDRIVVHRPYQMPQIFPILGDEGDNLGIFFSDTAARAPFSALAVNSVAELHLCASTDGFQCLPLYYYKDGNRIDNITDWGLTKFQTHYTDPTITKETIFHYTYAVLHHPAYRTKYELNLKRKFPRLPFYANFHQWATWGKALMNLHLNYETIEPYGLRRVDTSTTKATSDSSLQGTLLSTNVPDPSKPIKRTVPKTKLEAHPNEGKIILDTETTLEGVPKIAWNYKLGNRSALEWILDQYKEKTPKDPTIAQLFNTYKFADYKEHVIDLLQRVCTVSVKTMEIIQHMPTEC